MSKPGSDAPTPTIITQFRSVPADAEDMYPNRPVTFVVRAHTLLRQLLVKLRRVRVTNPTLLTAEAARALAETPVRSPDAAVEPLWPDGWGETVPTPAPVKRIERVTDAAWDWDAVPHWARHYRALLKVQEVVFQGLDADGFRLRWLGPLRDRLLDIGADAGTPGTAARLAREALDGLVRYIGAGEPMPDPESHPTELILQPSYTWRLDTQTLATAATSPVCDFEIEEQRRWPDVRRTDPLVDAAMIALGRSPEDDSSESGPENGPSEPIGLTAEIVSQATAFAEVTFERITNLVRIVRQEHQCHRAWGPAGFLHSLHSLHRSVCPPWMTRDWISELRPVRLGSRAVIAELEAIRTDRKPRQIGVVSQPSAHEAVIAVAEWLVGVVREAVASTVPSVNAEVDRLTIDSTYHYTELPKAFEWLRENHRETLDALDERGRGLLSAELRVEARHLHNRALAQQPLPLQPHSPVSPKTTTTGGQPADAGEPIDANPLTDETVEKSGQAAPVESHPKDWSSMGDIKREILTVLAAQTGPIRAQAIAGKTRSKYSAATLYHHFSTLAEWGYLEKKSGGYVVTQRGAELVKGNT